MIDYDNHSTTTCDGGTPNVCVTIYPPFQVTHDSGDIVFMLALVLFVNLLQYMPRLFSYFVKSPK